MSTNKIYDLRAVVEAYVDAQRPPYPHEDFRTFRKKRLAALESAYGIRIALDGIRERNLLPLSMHFNAVTSSLLGLAGPRAAYLEDSLINTTIARVDTPRLKLIETEALLHDHLKACRQAHLELLDALFVVLWGPIEHPITSTDLAKLGFDDAAEPKIWNYYDEM